MIACISPNSLFLEETVNTLTYASRAILIKGKVPLSIICSVQLNSIRSRGILKKSTMTLSSKQS